MRTKTLHQASGAAGGLLVAASVILAVGFSYPRFYTLFALGSWLALDWIDWKRNGSSILGYFYQHRHRDAFALFFFSATALCLLIDYGYGVRLSGMWEWIGYRPMDFALMYVFMNAAYVLGMYELFRVVRSALASHVSSRHLVQIRVGESAKRHTCEAMVFFGALFILVPLYALVLGTDARIEYAMALPFIGMVFLADGLAGLLGGRPVLAEMARGNLRDIAAAGLTIALAVAVTEGLNLFGGEWKYARMPFGHVAIAGVPVAVFIGWIPLVVGAIALVNFIRQADLVLDRAKAD